MYHVTDYIVENHKGHSHKLQLLIHLYGKKKTARVATADGVNCSCNRSITTSKVGRVADQSIQPCHDRMERREFRLAVVDGGDLFQSN